MPSDLVSRKRKEKKRNFVWRHHHRDNTHRKKILIGPCSDMLCYFLFVCLIYITFVLQLFIQSAKVGAEIGVLSHLIG